MRNKTTSLRKIMDNFCKSLREKVFVGSVVFYCPEAEGSWEEKKCSVYVIRGHNKF